MFKKMTKSPLTFEEMLSRCEEQTDSAHDPIKIKFETWDVTMRCVTQHMEPNMDHDKEFQRTSRDDKEDEEQGRTCHRANMSMYQVDPKFQNHMARCACTEMKMQDHQDNDKESVPINQEMDNQPSKGKRKHDDEEDDQKPTAKPKTDIPEDDEENQNDDNQENQDDDEEETIKKECIHEMFKRHFKSMLGPQDDDN